MKPLPIDPPAALAELIQLSAAMADEGSTLIERVLPSPPANYIQWEHYPAGDAIDPLSRARWFYHAHPPEQRGAGEHGHFHLFLPLSAFEGLEPLATPVKPDAAEVVHVAAMCFNTDGLPTHWIATNQWVTEEFMFPAAAVIARLDGCNLSGAGEAQGISHVGRWLTCALICARGDIVELLHRRDAALERTAPRDKAAEVLASAPFRV